jgi:glycosyltransferase involved in cell wall biosynthesis
MTDTPLVSIVTPTYNAINYLELCIKNVLNQSYPSIEHILVDAGSTDGTLDMLSMYKDKYPDRIVYISEPDNGVGEALNKGLKMARGEILGWLDADDLYEPSAVMAAVEFFSSNPDSYYVFGGCNIIDAAGEIIGEVPIKDIDFKKVVRGEHYISLSAAFFRREIIESVGYFNQIGNNLDYWIRVSQKFKMYRMDRVLSNWRLDRESVGFSREPRKAMMIKRKLREDYLLCRQYGGGILATRCRKYFLFVLLNKLGLFHFLNREVRFGLRRHRLVGRVLRMWGG